jgi:lipoprotein LprG
MLSGTHPARGRLVALLGVLLASALLLSGCGGDSKAKDEPKGKSPTEAMTQAKKLFDDASSVHIDLSTDATPPAGSNGVLGASGDINHDPAFKGEVKVVLGGNTLNTPVTSVGGKVYAKILSTAYITINPADYDAPDPADFADPDKGLSALLTQLDGLKKGKETRSGDQILTSYTGTLPGAAVKEIIPSASAKKTYETEVGVDEKGYATTVKVTGVFFSDDKDVTYDVKLSDYGKGVKITAPSA